MFLTDIVEETRFENNNLECKARLNRDDMNGWLKTIAGFANVHGGDFYIGVEDKTNKLIGFDQREADNERNYFNNQVNQHLVPRPAMKISFIRYVIREQERFIIHIHVYESMYKPVVLNYKNIPSIYVRREGFTNGATYEEIINMATESKNVQYDVMISDVLYDWQCFNTLRQFYSDHNDGKQLSEKALQSMGFYDTNGYLANGAVLFQDDYDGDKTSVHCSLFSGFTKGSQRIVTINRYQGNIIDTVNDMMEFVTSKMNHSMIKLDTSRINIEAYPPRALLEGIINAVAHRDYYLTGAQIQVDMFKDRLEISSPGGFFQGDKIEKTYDLSKIISKRRNELIASIFVSCNVMEAAGTGFDKIMEAYKDAGQRHRPYVYSASDHFTLVLPDLTYEKGIVDEDVPEILYVPLENGTKHDKQVLSFCFYQERSAKEIADFLNISDSSYFRKAVLENLVSNDYLIKNKRANKALFKTNPDMVNVE